MISVELQGLADYEEVHALQQRLVALRAGGEIDDVILLLEHAPVITVGRSRGALANVLAAGETPVVTVERGGDVTWHGPGQLVAYPIIALSGERADLHLHLRSLEDAVMGLLQELGLPGQRDDRNTGVWLPADPLPQKVCSVGIACRRWVTWHGLALNVNPDLAAFGRINPCGFDSAVMTRLADQMEAPEVRSLVPPLVAHLARALGVTHRRSLACEVGEVEAHCRSAGS